MIYALPTPPQRRPGRRQDKCPSNWITKPAVEAVEPPAQLTLSKRRHLCKSSMANGRNELLIRLSPAHLTGEKTALIAKSMAQNATTWRRWLKGGWGLPKVSLTALITLHFKCEDWSETRKSMLRFCSYFAATEAEEQSAKEIAGDNNRDAEGVRRLKEIVTVKERGEREREQAPACSSMKEKAAAGKHEVMSIICAKLPLTSWLAAPVVLLHHHHYRNKLLPLLAGARVAPRVSRERCRVAYRIALDSNANYMALQMSARQLDQARPSHAKQAGSRQIGRRWQRHWRVESAVGEDGADDSRWPWRENGSWIGIKWIKYE